MSLQRMLGLGRSISGGHSRSPSLLPSISPTGSLPNGLSAAPSGTEPADKAEAQRGGGEQGGSRR
eukprot:14050-Prorocentrum_minimum.AAC.1